MNTKKIFQLVSLLLILLTLNGCWDNRDITRESFVTAVGFDKGHDGELEMTMQIVKPSVIKAGQNGGTKESATWVSSTKGDTVFETLQNQMTVVNRRPFYGHMQIIIIGEELAKKGLGEILDFFERNPEPRLTSIILIAKDITAKEVLEAESNLEDIPAFHIKEIVDNNKYYGKTKKVELFDVIDTIRFIGFNPTIGVIKPKTQNKVENIKDLVVQGSAIFKESKLIGFLDQFDTRGLNFVQNEIDHPAGHVDNPFSQSKNISIELSNSQSKMDITLNNGQPTLIVNLKAQGNIAEQQGSGDLTDPKILREIENKIEKVIKKQIYIVFNSAQNKYKTDFIGYCKIMHRKYPQYWNKIKNNWDKEFSSYPVEINVDFKIKRTGLVKGHVK